MQGPVLRPRSAGEILDAAFQFMRAEYPALLLGTGVFLVPPILLTAMFPAGAALWGLLGGLLRIAAAVVPVVMVTDYLLGRPVDVKGAISTVTRRFRPIWASAIMFGILTTFGFVLLIVPGVIAFARLFAMPSVVVVEGADSTVAYERSKEITRDSMGHILATLGVAWVVFYAVSIGLNVASLSIAAWTGVSPQLIALVVQVITIGVFPFVGVVSAMLYIDLRVRKEALDLQLMTAALPVEPATAMAG